jgi:type IV pilus assembly protein PilC
LPRFAYAAIDTTGTQVNGTIKADTRGAVKAVLAEKQLYPVTIEEKRGALDIEITRDKLKKTQLMHFSRQLAVFVKAGVPLIDSLDTIEEEAQDKVLRRTLTDMSQRLRGGSTFADACAAHPEAFPPFYLGILRAAELTGNLDETLDQLADYLDREIEAKQKVVAALLYPAIVVGLAFATIGVLSVYTLPAFRDFFGDLGAELPLPTRIMLAITDIVLDFWWVFVLVFLVFIIFSVWLNLNDTGKGLRDKMLLGAPVIGGIVQYAIFERFCRILSSMVAAGVPLTEALNVTTDATNNKVFIEKLREAEAKIQVGAGFSQPINETGLFPGAARQMFKVGEETGTLESQLKTAALYFERELDMRIKRFTTLFEPAMILIVGGIVGFVALALISAIYGSFGAIED